ncbi:MAG TPA: hypothetical protein VGO93_30870 [Candidatus Xenobia bacterium]|jgi:hypothetical protein
MDFDLLLRVVEALENHGVHYKVVGAAALNFLGVLRGTEDADIFVEPDPDNIERLKQALTSIWQDPEIQAINSQELCDNYPSVRYGPPWGEIMFDFLTRLGEAFSYESLETRVVNVKGVRVCCVTPKQLYKMKIDTVRPQDKIDAEAVREAYPQEVPGDVD